MSCHSPASRTRAHQLARVQRRRGWQSRDLQDFLLVEGLPREQSFGEGVELLAMLGQQAP
ncbi:MAG: hypothetical protein V7640_1943, partial [Betaproteobacteria bacterium]